MERIVIPRNGPMLRQPIPFILAALFAGAPAAGCERARSEQQSSHAQRATRSAGPVLVYVSNEDSGDISVIDAQTDELVGTIPVGKRPRGLRLSPDQQTLYVAVSGSPKAPPGSDESKLPAPDRSADGIAVIDLQRGRVVKTLPGGSDPESFDLSPDGRLAYVANEDAAQASTVDVASGKLLGTLRVGGEPEGVASCPDGSCVYVTSEQDGQVDVIDTRRGAVATRIATGARPRAVIFTADGKRAFVSNELAATVSVVDAQQHALLAQIPLRAPGARPMGLALSPDERTLFVTTGRGGSLVSIDVASGAAKHVVAQVGARPWGVAGDPSGRKLYTANGPSHDVSVIDVARGRVLKRIPVGRSPWGVAVASAPVAAASAAAAPPQGDELEQLSRDDAQWVMVGKNYENTRFSGLAEIHAGNVRGLRVAWAFGTGISKGHEAAPLVIGSTMYLVTPFPNRLIALALGAGAAKLAWIYDPEPNRAAQGVACCDVVNRGPAYASGKIIYNTLDNHTVAVDAASGREVWKTKLGEINRGESMTMAPLVVRGKVLVGNSGGEFGVRGWLSALDLESGQLAWRAYSTGPDRDVLIGPAFKPFYASDRGADLGVHSWPAGKWQQGGGTVWGFVSYDPLLDLIYHGTGNPGPWNPEQREGDNKWTCGVFARRPDNGDAAWFYQWTPHDVHDYDGINENILVELALDGRRRRVLVHPERNGYVYVLDRASGEVLSATPFAHITTSRGVDPQTGQLQTVQARSTGTSRIVRNICPASPGAKDWQPAAYSSQTELLYIPGNNLCEDEQGYEANYIAGTPYVGSHTRMYGGPGGHRGELIAWDVAKRAARFRVREEFPVWSGVLATAGELVFYGTLDGWFKALHARSGQELWKLKLGSGVIGQPVTFRGPDGKQYVSVFAGVGGWAGAVVAGDLDRNDTTAALGFVGATGDLSAHVDKGGTLYTFALP